MERVRKFIDRDMFDELIHEIRCADGTEYQDIDVIYGDMSRLIVAWLACTPYKELAELYNKLGWKSSASSRAFHMAAKHWLEKYHPGRCPVVPDPS